MNDLIRFLLARVDDDEDELKKLSRQHTRQGVAFPASGVRSLDRVRAECVSKRQLLGTIQALLVLRDQPQEKPVRDAAAAMLQALALPYADHAGYRKHWVDEPVA